MFPACRLYRSVRIGEIPAAEKIKTAVRLFHASRFASIGSAVGARMIVLKFRTLQKANRPGRRAQIPCPAAEGFDSMFRKEHPPHPLAPRAFAFAWQAGIRQDFRARRTALRVCRAGYCGCLAAGTSLTWGSSLQNVDLFYPIRVFRRFQAVLSVSFASRSFFFAFSHAGSA